ncbi:hypothetical protein SUDANB58_00043 [Streptomyces sp. enrichment culture]
MRLFPSPERPGADGGGGAGLASTASTPDGILQVRAAVERGVARLKSWRILRRSRCSPNRMTDIAAAVLTLERQR